MQREREPSGQKLEGFLGAGAGPHGGKERFSKDASEAHRPPLRMLACLLLLKAIATKCIVVFLDTGEDKGKIFPISEL